MAAGSGEKSLQDMTIAIIGTGEMGLALGHAYIRAGLKVVYGSRNPDAVRPKVLEYFADVPKADVPVMAQATALAAADVFVIALPAHVPDGVDPTISFLDENRDVIVGKGKIAIDLTDPYWWAEGKPNPCAPFFSSLEFHSNHLNDPHTHWAAAYKVLWWKSVRYDKFQPVELVGDATAKRVVGALIQSHGFEPLDRGLVADAPLLEPKGPKRVKPPGV